MPDLPAVPRRPRPPSTKAGQVKSVTEEPPRSPSGQGGARAGKCHWRWSVLQYMRPTETLSCPGTGLGPQRAAQDALGHPLPQGWTGLQGQGLELGKWSWERKGVWKEEERKELPSCKFLPGKEGLFFFLPINGYFCSPPYLLMGLQQGRTLPWPLPCQALPSARSSETQIQATCPTQAVFSH